MNNFEINLKHSLETLDELSLIYTPGVGFASKEIAVDMQKVNSLTNRRNSVAIIFDVQEYPESYLPYAQAISNIIKKIYNLDAYPLVNCGYDINKVVENLEPTFGGFYIFSNNKISLENFNTISTSLEKFNIDEIIENFKKILANLENSDVIMPQTDENSFRTEALMLRYNLKGVISIKNMFSDISLEELKIKYSKEKLDELSTKIRNNPELAKQLTMKKDTIAIISDGSAVLGLGNIGAYGALPVMEGKAAIFKKLGNVNAIPICLKTQDIDEIIKISASLSYSFGGINLEDINAPRCFEIEEKLTAIVDIPVFHDDQHGTAIIVLSALLGALKLAEKNISDVKIVMSGAGAAAQAVAKLLLKAGAKNLIMSDIDGVISTTSKHQDKYLKKLAQITNPYGENGSLKDVLVNADVLIGLSAPNIVTKEMIKTMNSKAIVFALANPIPEIMPNIAKEAGAFIVATGRSDFENQINNSLAFPGVFKGLLSKNIKNVTDEIKYQSALAISKYAQKELSVNKILPQALDLGIVDEIANIM